MKASESLAIPANILSALVIGMSALSLVGPVEAAEPKTGESLSTGYHLVADFPRLPAGWSLGAVSGVATDPSGNVLVFHRSEHPILVFDGH